MDRAIIDAAAAPARAKFLSAGVRRYRAGGGPGRRVLRAPDDPAGRADRPGGRARGAGGPLELVTVQSARRDRPAAATFNDTVVRLRSLVQTETERDEERRKREELQHNITSFLDTAMEIAQGDLTRRGEVTSDVLGSVVDAINLMVEETRDRRGRRAPRRLPQCPASASEIIGAIESDGQRRPDPVPGSASVSDAVETVSRARCDGRPRPRSLRGGRRPDAGGRHGRASRRCATASPACSGFAARCRASPRRSRASAIARSKSPRS